MIGGTDAPVLGRVRQFVQIIEPVQVEMGKVTVDANAIQGGLRRDGKIALYDVTFDTNKATLNPQSGAQLGRMAPALKVFIVSHTDNQGELTRNSALSQQRADAVVTVLSGRCGIAPARLLGRAVANLAPVASNDTEQGRARNRRVEWSCADPLVKELSMHVNTQLKLLVGAADLIASGAALAANAALISAYPPPGLYRVDTQATRRSIKAIRRPSCSNMCRKAPAAVSGSRGGASERRR